MRTTSEIPIPGMPAVGEIGAPMVYIHRETAWEYRVIRRDLAEENLPEEKELNELGQDGWELVGLFAQEQTLYLYFKRLVDW